MNKYVIHPMAMMFPEMSQRDFDELKESISKVGQQEAIVTDANTGVVIDGRHRLKACEALGIAPRFRSLTLTDGSTVEDYIWTHNAVRRHLTDDQRAILATQWTEALEKQAKERQSAGKTPAGEITRTPSDDRHATRTAIAKRANVSSEKAKQAMTVKKNAPHLVPKVAAGEMKLKDAAKAAKPTKPAKQAEAKQPTGRSAKIAKAYKDRLKKVLFGSVEGGIEGITSLDIARISSACTAEEVKQLVKTSRELASRLKVFAQKLEEEQKAKAEVKP